MPARELALPPHRSNRRWQRPSESLSHRFDRSWTVRAR